MKKAIILGCLVFAVLYIAGCGNSVVGTYKTIDGSQLDVGKYGIAKLTSSPVPGGATNQTINEEYIPYKVKGDILSLFTNGKVTDAFKIQGNKLISIENASVWTKTAGSGSSSLPGPNIHQ